MTNTNTKKAINSTHKNTKLNIDLTSVLIDKTLQESASIMYIRQATYFYLLKLNGWTRGELHKAIKQRASVTNTPYNKGVLVKESAVAEYAINNLTNLFNSIKITKNNFESVISKIAGIMTKNNISYTYLKDKIQKNPTESDKNKTNSEESKLEKIEISFDAVACFIKNTTQENRLKLCDLLDAAIRAYVENKQKSKKAA